MTGVLLNPQAYSHWANCGIGSMVTTEEIAQTTMDSGVLRNVTICKSTLVALDSVKATVAMEISGAANGAPFEQKFTLEISAHPAPETEEGLLSFEQLFQGTAPKEADETIDVAGRPLVCRRLDHTTTLHGQPFSVSFWMSDQVPGGIARTEDRMGTGPVTKRTVTAFTKK